MCEGVAARAEAALHGLRSMPLRSGSKPFVRHHSWIARSMSPWPKPTSSRDSVSPRRIVRVARLSQASVGPLPRVTVLTLERSLRHALNSSKLTALSSISSDWVLLSSKLLISLADSSKAEGFGNEAGAKGHSEALRLAFYSSHDAVKDEHEGR